MRKQEYDYNIYDILSFCVQGGSQPWIQSAIHTEYQNFVSNMRSDPDLTVIIGDFHPDCVDCTVLDNTFYIKRDYLYCEDSYNRARWKFELTGLESGHTQLKISGNYFAKYIIPGFLIDPIIAYKLNELGCSLIHSSAVCNDHGAHLFTAQGGGGKTSTALYATERGCQFMGDNFVILHQGQVMPYLSPLNLFSFNMLPYLEKRIPRQIKLGYYMRKGLFSLLGINLVTKVNPSDVGLNPHFVSSPIHTICMLVPHEGFNVSKTELNNLVQHMVFNLKVDFSNFTKYLMQYSFVFPNSPLRTYWSKYEKNLAHNLQNFQRSYMIEVPQKYDKGTFEQIWKLIK